MFFIIKNVSTLLLVFLMVGCSCLPTPEYADITFDYQVKPPYEMGKSYKRLNVNLDVTDVSLPEKTFKDESFKFDWTPSAKNAHIAVYIRLSNSFLIDRENANKSELVYDKKGKGSFIITPIQRGYIRTHYTIEVIDEIKKTLIHQVSLAGNYSIEAELTNDSVNNKKILKDAFYKHRKAARKQLLKDIWHDLKTRDLALIQTTFGQEKDKVVSHLQGENKFELAYKYLKTNKKRNALKALNLYNQGLVKYKDKDDKLSNFIRRHLDHGISVSSRIANHQYPDRY